MPGWLDIDWTRLFVPKEAVGEIVLRGTLVYLFLFVVLRVFPRRTTGALGIGDLVVLIMIADAAANAMGANYESVTEGALLVITLVFWNTVLAWASHRFPAFERLTQEQPINLVEDGRLMRRNMDREKVTEAELLKMLRQHGVEDPAEVRRAVLEDDGRLSVIQREAGAEGGGRSAGRRAATAGVRGGEGPPVPTLAVMAGPVPAIRAVLPGAAHDMRAIRAAPSLLPSAPRSGVDGRDEPGPDKGGGRMGRRG